MNLKTTPNNTKQHQTMAKSAPKRKNMLNKPKTDPTETLEQPKTETKLTQSTS
jgi:hypothetical protein